MKKVLWFVFALCLSVQMMARSEFGEQPKLVVGIVVDQMRWDYLSRYYDKFQEDGLRRLVDKGYSCDNCLINYVPTITAIGHTSAYTGSTPAFHGICGNDFCIDDEKVYCTTDKSVKPVGTDNNKRGQNAAYWLDIDNGQFITSTYYMKELPAWAKAYNQTLAANGEVKKAGKQIGRSPLCGHITTDMAIAALKGENLGKNEATDMLCVSFSQTDLIGHEWSTRGTHIDEAYLELDKDIAKLLKAFDEQVGEGNYLVFLTADHGAAHNAEWMTYHKLAGGTWKINEDVLNAKLDQYLREKVGVDRSVINGLYAYRVYLNHGKIAEKGVALADVKQALINYFRQMPHVQFVMDFEKVNTWSVPDRLRSMALLGYHPHRSGDLLLVLESGWYEFWPSTSPVGTTHGSWNPYDAHIPLLFYGWHVGHGHTSREVHITDIAPTICQMLHIQQTNACVGEAIGEVVDQD